MAVVREFGDGTKTFAYQIGAVVREFWYGKKTFAYQIEDLGPA